MRTDVILMQWSIPYGRLSTIVIGYNVEAIGAHGSANNEASWRITMFGRMFRKKSFELDLDEELEAHLEIEARLLMERGLSPEAAMLKARRTFGNRTQIAESTREAWGWEWLDRLLQDLRYAARTLRHSPAFTIAAVLSLGLGIGGSTAVFSIADSVFLRPLPYPHPEQLAWVANKFPGMDTEFLASPDYVAWRRDNRVFQQLAATQARGGETMLLNGSDPAEVHVVKVSSNFLQTLQVRLALGRDFTADEELPDGPKAVLLSNKLWRRRFGAKATAVGRSLMMDGQQYTIAGVLPATFVFPMDVNVDIMTTLPVSPTASHHDILMMTWAVYGRLKDGVTITQARSDLQRLFAISKSDVPLMFRSDTKLVVEPLQQYRAGNAKLLVSVLIGAVSCLLLIACVNVSNLLLGRWSARSGELAVRAAIGAGRRRLAKQLFTEAILLAAGGFALSIVFVNAVLRGFVHYAAGELPRLSEVRLDARVFAIGLTVSMLTTLIFSGLPVLRTGRMNIQQILQQSGRPGMTAGYLFARRALVVAEVALSLILLFGASLLLETLWHLRNDRLGFQPEHVLTVTIPLKGTKLENRSRDELIAGLLTFARRIPGAEAVAQSECTPLSAGFLSSTFSRSDRPAPEAFHRGDVIHVCGATDGFAKAAGMRMVRGRFFEEGDSLHPNTLAVINETAARSYFPGENPIGKQIMGGPQHQWKTVVGIVSDTKNRGLDAKPGPQAYVNGLTYPEATALQLIVRGIGSQQSLEPAISAEIRKADPGLLVKFESLDEKIDDMTAGPRFNGILLASFAAVAVLMAVIGVYGLLSFTISQRRSEIGIRIALGAARGRILRLVLQEGSVLIVIGVAVGLAGALGLAHYLRAVLYGISATDPATLLIVAGGLIATGLIAISLPACKAASIDPMIALRHC
jgi:predicted permease